MQSVTMCALDGRDIRDRQRYKRDGMQVYKLVEYDGEPKKGSFYERELQIMDVSASTK